MSTFGKNLISIREANQLTQTEFAKRMDTTQQRVSEWETDKIAPSLFTTIKIIRVLKTSFDELTEGIDLEKTKIEHITDEDKVMTTPKRGGMRKP